MGLFASQIINFIYIASNISHRILDFVLNLDLKKHCNWKQNLYVDHKCKDLVSMLTSFKCERTYIRKTKCSTKCKNIATINIKNASSESCSYTYTTYN